MRLPTMRPMRALLVAADLQRGKEIVEVLDRAERPFPKPTSSSSTTAARTARPTWPKGGWGSEHGGGVSVLRRSSKSGLGSAYRAGFAQGLALGYDALIEMDLDLFSTTRLALPALISAVDSGADLARLSRDVPGGAIPDWPKHREYLSRGGNRYAAIMLGLPRSANATAGSPLLTPPPCSARIDLDAIAPPTGTGSRSRWPTPWPGGAGRIVEVPISFTDRVRGTLEDVQQRSCSRPSASSPGGAIRDRIVHRNRPVE